MEEGGRGRVRGKSTHGDSLTEWSKSIRQADLSHVEHVKFGWDVQLVPSQLSIPSVVATSVAPGDTILQLFSADTVKL